MPCLGANFRLTLLIPHVNANIINNGKMATYGQKLKAFNFNGTFEISFKHFNDSSKD